MNDSRYFLQAKMTPGQCNANANVEEHPRSERPMSPIKAPSGMCLTVPRMDPPRPAPTPSTTHHLTSLTHLPPHIKNRASAQASEHLVAHSPPSTPSEQTGALSCYLPPNNAVATGFLHVQRQLGEGEAASASSHWLCVAIQHT
jgi:hypothetical protein